MQSRLLDSLLDQAQTAPDRVEWARAVCRAASHMARSGQPEHALATIGKVREEFGPGLHPGVASWLMLAEGILHFCKFETAAAYDRIQRAHGLAVAFQLAPAISPCAAWLSLIELNTRRFERMVSHINEVIRHAEPNDHQAWARAALVVACALQASGDFALARPWYDRARLHASAEGDEATLGALLFNMASFRMMHVRILDAFDMPATHESRLAFAEAAGSFNYDSMTGNSNQQPWRLLLRGQHFVAEKRYEEGKEVLEQIQFDSLDSPKNAPLIQADLAWCYANLGRTDDAKSLREAVRKKMDLVFDPDDRAVIFGRLAQVSSALGEVQEAAELRANASTALDEHRSFQRQLLATLAGLESLPKVKKPGDSRA